MRRVVVPVFSGVQLMDIAGPLEVFDAAGRVFEEKLYEPVVTSTDGGLVPATAGVSIDTIPVDDALRGPVDLLMVPGALDVSSMIANTMHIAAVRRLATRATTTASVCTGAFVLGELSLLDGKQAATHWAFTAELARRYPKVAVDADRLFVRDGDIYTCGGVTSGMDLALAIVASHHGRSLARQVAKWMVIYLQRPGSQSQFGIQATMPDVHAPEIRSAIDDIITNPSADLSVSQLAKRVGISRRHFARLFRQHTGTTPGRFIETTRIQLARSLLETTDAPHEMIARQCGFSNAEALRQAFHRHHGISPHQHRVAFGGNAQATT